MQTQRTVTVTLTLTLEPATGYQHLTDEALAVAVADEINIALPRMFWLGYPGGDTDRWRPVGDTIIAVRTEPVAG